VLGFHCLENFMTDEQIHNIVATIVSTNELPILGAKLGTLVRQALHDNESVDLKGRFGGLKGMISQCAGDLLRPIGKQGVDDLYGWEHRSPSRLTG
jgi:hypothetical protein